MVAQSDTCLGRDGNKKKKNGTWLAPSVLVSELAEELSRKENEMEALACRFSQLGGWRVMIQIGSVLTSPSWNPMAWIPQEESGGRKKVKTGGQKTLRCALW